MKCLVSSIKEETSKGNGFLDYAKPNVLGGGGRQPTRHGIHSVCHGPLSRRVAGAVRAHKGRTDEGHAREVFKGGRREAGGRPEGGRGREGGGREVVTKIMLQRYMY